MKPAVIRMSDQFEMRWMNARSAPACVVKIKTLWDRPLRELVRHAMCPPGPSMIEDVAVTVLEDPRPDQTVAVYTNVRDEIHVSLARQP
jgi:hypothetical protein